MLSGKFKTFVKDTPWVHAGKMAEADFGAIASSDLVKLAVADASSINVALAERYEADEIYTNIGQVLVCVNPYKALTRAGLTLYDDSIALDFRNGDRRMQLEPHIFGIAAAAYNEVIKVHEPQCIVVSGDSGAGKTETCKQIMGFITIVEDAERRSADDCAAAGSDASRRRGSSVYAPPGATAGGIHLGDHLKGTSAMDKLMVQLMESNFLLETFGNAQTVRNNNSSRFGKYIEIQFRYGGKVAGGKVTEYLLEKVRVVEQKPAERNYHVFYQLLAAAAAGAAPTARVASMLRDPTEYAYLSHEDKKITGIDDGADFVRLVSSLSVLGVDAAQQDDIWRLLGGVLELGEVELDEEAGIAKVAERSCARLACAAQLLGLDDAAVLEFALTKRQMRMGGRSSVAVKTLSVAEAHVTRDTLAQAVYQRLFRWLVQRINAQIQCHDPSLCPIGLLDIYGFEIFESNSLEQFFINYVNEKLQQLFIETILQKQQEEYLAEGITWTTVEYFNNKVVCELIEKRPGGMMALVDEQCAIGQSTPVGLMTALRTQHGDHRHFVPPKSQHSTAFVIAHYAGDVEYDCALFVDKNRDTLFNELVEAMERSTNALGAQLFDDKRSDAQKTKRPPTSSQQFKKQVSALMADLHGCNAHYVRCLKPNESKKPGDYDMERMKDQIVFMGLIENVRIAQAGYSYRETFAGFLWRYKMVCKETWPAPPPGTSNGAACAMVMAAAGFGEPGDGSAGSLYVLGNTKIFIKNISPLATLEKMRVQALAPIVLSLQSRARAYVERSYFMIKKRGADRIAAEHKRRIGARQWAAQRVGVIVLQRRGRGLVQRKRWLLYKAQMYASFRINAWVRMILCRIHLPAGWTARIREAGEAVRRKKRNAVTRIAATYRGLLALRSYREYRAATAIQAAGRRAAAMAAYRRILAAVRLGAYGRGYVARIAYKRSRNAQVAIAARLRILLARTRRRVLAQRRLLQFKMMMLDGVRVTKVRLCLRQHSNTAPKLTAPVHPRVVPSLFVARAERARGQQAHREKAVAFAQLRHPQDELVCTGRGRQPKPRRARVYNSRG